MDANVGEAPANYFLGDKRLPAGALGQSACLGLRWETSKIWAAGIPILPLGH